MFYRCSAAAEAVQIPTRSFPALRVCLAALLTSMSTGAALGQILPSQGTTPSAPDDWLFGTGPSWYYRASPSPVPREVGFRKPTPEEAEVVRRAEALLAGSSGKAMALISGNEVVWAGFKPPASRSRLFMGFSMGKTITALAVGKAICAGKLKLNSLAGDVLPDLKTTDLGAASVRDLLRMTSGTWEGTNGDLFRIARRNARHGELLSTRRDWVGPDGVECARRWKTPGARCTGKRLMGTSRACAHCPRDACSEPR